MSETKEIFNCLTELKGEIVQINRQLGEVNTKIGQMDAKIGQMDAKIGQMDARMDQMDAKIGQMDAKIGQMDAKIGQMDARMDQMDTRMSSLEEKMERGFAEIKQEFDEKLSLVEFGLDAEIQKVYEIALDNQANIERIRLRQSNYQIDSIARQQIAAVADRVEVVERVVESHSEVIRELKDEIA